MKKTKTYTFGVGKRESHDSSDFYNRNLYDDNLFKSIFSQEIPLKELIVGEVQLGDWVDKIHCQSSENMAIIPDNSIGLAFTSPPYNVGKVYDHDINLKEYLNLIENVAREVYRVLRPGGRYVVNIANLGRKPYIPLHAFFYGVHLKVGFLPMGEIIWQKAKGASGNVAWGSWKSAKSPRPRDVHEYLLVFAKQSYSRPDDGESKISSTEFMDGTLSIWDLPAESATRVEHPAPFSEPLARRVIDLFSYTGDVILDPFVGSGTTCVVAKKRGRHYIGFDISKKYCELARRRIEGKGKTYMPSEKTESSELSVGFGILGINDPLDLTYSDIKRYFEGTLSPEKYDRFKVEFTHPKNSRLYSRLHNLGKKLRKEYPLFKNVKYLKWSGPEKQAKTNSGAQDLIAVNTPVSVKAESNIVSNLSPINIFEKVPLGKVAPDRSENWYLHVDPEGYQSLYSSVRDIRLVHFPSSVEDFEKTATPKLREELQLEITKLSDTQKTSFNKQYLKMCKDVATTSAAIFNQSYQKGRTGDSRTAVTEHLVKSLFRINSVEYILAGSGGKYDYAVIIPSITEWKKEWEIVSVEAVPDLEKKQSVVNIQVEYKNKKSKASYIANFHIEIRWSHGKFRSSPEAKLYKNFKWAEIAFTKSIFS